MKIGQKAEAFVTHLESVFQPSEEINLELDEQVSEEIPFVTPKEVAMEIKLNINPKEAPGYHLIKVQYLKRYPEKEL